MTRPLKKTTPKQVNHPDKITSATSSDILRNLAFDNSLQANIITTASNGSIIVANKAACKLLGYSGKEMLTKSRSVIFDIKEEGFKLMLKERKADGHSKATVTAIKKNGKLIPCEITSAVFMDEEGVEKAITTIADISESILKQKNIDTENEKHVAYNIDQAISKQKGIDNKNEKIVAGNILNAKAKQQKLDIKNKKIVAANIDLQKAKQKSIDIKREEIVAEDIVIALAKSDARMAENNEWIKYIARASYDVMWDWDVESGSIYVGESVKEVFGYSLKKNMTSFINFLACLLPEDKALIEKKLFKTLHSTVKSWEDSFTFKRYDCSLASTTIRASIVRDEKGKAIRLIGALQDISRIEDLENKLEEQINIKEEKNEMFQLAAKLSYDGIWDWNLLTNEFFLGEGFEELFGYSFNNINNVAFDWADHLHPDDKEVVENGLKAAIGSSDNDWEETYRFVRADGSIANVLGRASIIRDAEGKACRMIGAIHNLSRHQELEEKLNREIAAKSKQLSEQAENFKLIFNSSSDVLYDSDLVANRVVLSDAYEKVFGYQLTNNTMTTEDWFSHIHPDDKKDLIQDYQRMLASADTQWKYSFRVLKADNSVINILTSGITLRNTAGKAYRRIGYLQDQSSRMELEERLEHEIKLKEKQIAEATEEAKETQRSDIGKELHDNVNQLLGASRLYLDMAKQGGANSEMYLSRSSQYTVSAIEEIRKLTKGLTTDILNDLGLCEAIDNIAMDTMEVNPVRIVCALDRLIENRVNDKFKLNVFRIVQEQLNNILKHAKATEVTIRLSQRQRSIILSIADNGIGFDVAKKMKGIGIENIKSRAEFYNAVTGFISQPGQGCVLTVTFPIADILLKKD